MKTISISLLLALLSSASLFSTPQSPIAEKFLELVNQEQYESAAQMASPNMSIFLSEEKIKEFWQSLQSRYGKPILICTAEPQKSTKDSVFTIKLIFAQDSLNARVMVDSTNKISGFLFQPFPKNYTFQLPDYANSDNYAEEETEFGLDGWLLPATLSIPKGVGKFPAVVLVHGSGPSDRDVTIGGHKVFRDIAAGLASRGIAVFRYEKRTKEHQSKVMRMQKDLTVAEETIIDAIEAVKFLKNHKQIDSDKIFVLGHSLGGYLSPKIASDYTNLAGIIIMNGNARPLYDLVVEQYKYIFGLDGEINDLEKIEIERVTMQAELLRQRKIDENTGTDSLLLRLPAKYWLDLLDYSPIETARKIDIPILIMQAESDYQVTMEDYRLWKSGLKEKKNVEYKSLSNLNHLMVYTEGPSTPSEYERSGNVDVRIIEILSKWIESVK